MRDSCLTRHQLVQLPVKPVQGQAWVVCLHREGATIASPRQAHRSEGKAIPAQIRTGKPYLFDPQLRQPGLDQCPTAPQGSGQNQHGDQ